MANILGSNTDYITNSSHNVSQLSDRTAIDNKLNFTFNKAQEREINSALSNTFGFGGHNATLIFKKFME